MKKIIAVMALVPMMVMGKTSTPEGFGDNYDEALARAKESGKYIYVCFSGSDWCGWCMKLENEVFSDGTFAAALKDDWELVFIDSPSNKEVLSERAKKENPKLVEKFDIHGFPTALLQDSNGELIVKSGYREGGAAKYIEFMQDVRKRGPEIRDAEALEQKWLKPYENRGRKMIMGLMRKCDEIYRQNKDKGKSEDEIRVMCRPFVEKTVKEYSALIEEFQRAEMPTEIFKTRIEMSAAMREMLGKLQDSLEQNK